MTRDEKGHFAKGVSGNPKGRAPKQREAQYISVLVSCVSDTDWKEIITKAVTDAKRGDTAARKFLADYLIGPPVEKKEITGAGGNEIILKVVYERKDEPCA
jgi:hypothetical protein